MHPRFDVLLGHLLDACRRQYGDRLISLAVFGSVGRGTARHDSDVDLLIVADALPDGRVARVAEFRDVESAVAPALREARDAGLSPQLSPVFKTPAELRLGTPLLLDMVEDARILFDRADTLRGTLAALRARLEQSGARRIWKGNAWIWDLKPDYKPGEVFDL